MRIVPEVWKRYALYRDSRDFRDDKNHELLSLKSLLSLHYRARTQ